MNIYEKVLLGLAVLIITTPVLKLITKVLELIIRKRVNKQGRMIFNKVIFYTGYIIISLYVLSLFGIDMKTLMGAAGIFGIAIGFASQTSVSNIISGLFMIGEQPFAVGDVIEVGGNRGTVMSIDLLSIKLNTFNNRLIRIPNENLIKTDVVNITRYPIRRIDISLSVHYDSDLRKVLEKLISIAKSSDDILLNPEPLARIEQFGESGIEIFFGAWVQREKYVDTKNELMLTIKEEFNKEGIVIPYPHRTLLIEKDVSESSALVEGEAL